MMKKITTITLSLISLLCAAQAIPLKGYVPFDVPLYGELKDAVLPLMKKIEGKEASKILSSGISVMVPKADDDADGIIAASENILKADSNAIPQLISDPKEANRAVKILNMLGVNPTINATFRIGDFFFARFAIPKESKIRKGMNFFAFVRNGDKYLWVPSFSDPLLQILSEAEISPKSRVRPDIEISADGEPDKIIIYKLAGQNLPILRFSDTAFVSLGKSSGVDKDPAAEFYHATQEHFFAFKFDDYRKFMTQKSRQIFDSQFAALSDAERKEILKDYVSWEKEYLKVLRAGPINIIVFERHRNKSESQFDTAYIVLENGRPKIANFGAQKSPLDVFISQYVLKPTPYLENISEKFLRK